MNIQAKEINSQGRGDIKTELPDFPGGPVAKTLLSSAGSAGSIPAGGAEIPHALCPKKHKTEAIW